MIVSEWNCQVDKFHFNWDNYYPLALSTHFKCNPIFLRFYNVTQITRARVEPDRGGECLDKVQERETIYVPSPTLIHSRTLLTRSAATRPFPVSQWLINFPCQRTLPNYEHNPADYYNNRNRVILAICASNRRIVHTRQDLGSN